MNNSIKKFFLSLGISCLGLISFGQTVTIGFGTESNYNVPYSNYYKYAVTQSLYTASEIGNAGQIASVAYNVATASSFANQDVKIYMGHTSLSTFADKSEALTEDDLILVYEGTLTLGASTGWEKIYLNEVFNYNGTDNLVIAVARKIPKSGNFNTTLKYYYSSGSSLFCRSDSDNTCGEISHAMSNSWAYRPNVQIVFTPSLVDGYYQIADADDLLWFANYVNSGHSSINGKLTADIDLTDVDWTPIGNNSSHSYNGTFEGNGDTIRNLTYNKTADYVGLFGYVGSGGTIQNVGLVNSSITGSNYVGGIVGCLESGGTVSKCCNKGVVKGTNYVGGIVGNSEGNIENSYFTGVEGVSYASVVVNATTSYAGGICGYNTGAITSTYVGNRNSLKVTAGTSHAGGICGYNSGAVTYCHNIDFYISTQTYSGALIGQNGSGTYSSCTYYSSLAKDGNSTTQNGCGSETVGTKTTNPTGISSVNYDSQQKYIVGQYCYLLNGSVNGGSPWKQTIGEDKYPILDATHLSVYKTGYSFYSNREIVFSGGNSAPWSSPFDITSVEDLKNFAYLVNVGNSDVRGRLTVDIVLNERVLDENGNLRSDYKSANLEQWTPMASFSGDFYGNNHTISGLYINSSSTYVGLFSTTSSATITDLGIIDSYVSGNDYVGSLVGSANRSTITSCYNTGVVQGSSYYVGGLFGMAGGTITNCYNTGNVSSPRDDIGGIAGCFGYYGGPATVVGCYNTGNVTGTSTTSTSIGGIGGGALTTSNSFSKCYNTGTIIGSDKVGGCFGTFKSRESPLEEQTATNCYNIGSVVATGGDAGGVIGENTEGWQTETHGVPGVLTNCFNGGSVAGTGSVGGVAGTNLGTISYCYYNSDFCSYGGINSVDVENSAEAMTSAEFSSGTLPTNFESSVWTAGTTQGASGSIISDDGIMGYRVIGKYPSITSVGTAQDIIINYVNVGSGKTPEWINNFIPIYTITDFKNIKNNLSATYVLMNDVVETENYSNISVFTPTVNWPSIGTTGNPFKGKLYGNNHTIAGVYVNNAIEYGGVISYASDALIRDLGVIDSKMTGKYVAGVCGKVVNTSIDNCYNKAEVDGEYAGGITSYRPASGTTITRCRNYGSITATKGAGGIAAELWFANVSLCYNEGTIHSDLRAGGICGGGGYTSIYTSYNAGNVSGQIAGGILGEKGTTGHRYYCYNVGEVDGTVNKGAIMGLGSADIKKEYSYYDKNKSIVEGGINSADVPTVAEGKETDDLCLELQTGFSSDIWAIKEPVIVGNKKYLYYPYLKCFGEESANVGTYRPISRVVLNENGGTCTPLTQYIEREGAELPQDVVRDGYTFGGWYSNASCTSDEITEIPVTATGEQTFYAKWTANSYSITLNTNGGTINSGNVTTYTYGNSVMLPTDISKIGYTFGGWYTSSSFTGSSVQSVPSTATGNKTYYAKWTVNKYSVTFVTNNGTINAGNVTQYTYGVGATLPTNVTKTGYTFAGWYSNDSYAGERMTSISTTTTGDKTFYAKWNVNSYDITLNTDGGTINSGNIASYTYGVGATLPTDITKTGYRFEGWYDDSSDEPVLSILSTETGDRSFYAQWTKVPYTITLNANEGTLSGSNTMTYYYGNAAVVLPTPTRDGYTFGGWYNNSNLVGTVFTKVESTETGNKEFWAKWDVNIYTVSLDAKGGEINSGNVASYTYNVLTILPQDVTKVGHTFEGWFDSENQKVTQISKGTIGNVAFTAKWTAKTYNVTLQTNNGTINGATITSYTYGTGAILPTNITKTGYDFQGWYDNSSYDGGEVTEIASNEVGDRNFWAKWTAGLYDVTLNVVGGTINSNAIERYTYGVGAVLPTDVTKIGYTFKGWKDEEGHFALEITTADYGDKTFTAQWEQANYGITYNANGGSINESYEATYNYGNEITLPTDVTKDGCAFLGWYDNSNFTGEVVEAISATEYGDKTFYANWSANSYGVVFNTNEGTINSGNIEGYTYGVTAILPTDVTKDGYTFTGWYSDEDCEGDVVSIISSTETGNKTFYAGWSNTAYSITLHTNDGIISSGNVTAYTFGTEEQLPTEEQISKTGYKFDGWFDNASCSGEAISSVASTAIGDKQYWAKWSVNSYTVTFETDGGTINSGNVKNYIYGTTVVLPSDVIKLGYTFDGWYDNEACTGSSILSISSTDLGNKTFYANWIVNSYGITLVTNEGTINSGNVESYTYGVEATLPTNVTKSGYTFDGWFTNTSYLGSAVSSVLATETGDKTFYAKWSVNTYDVTLNVNGGTITNGEIDSYTYGVGAVLPLAKNMVKTGYTFVGWYANEEFAGESVTTIANNAVGEKTFYARWTINSYDVTLNANGGTINAGAFTSYEFGTAMPLPTEVTKTGYTFAGWYDNSNLVGETSTAISNEETGAKIFYAKWAVNTYSVTLNAKGGTINNGNVSIYTYGVGATLPADVTKTGWTFSGWYDNEDFLGEAVMTIANNETGDKQFFAKWNVNKYNVILVTNEGTINEGNLESYLFGEGATLPTDVTKTGYTFDGWYSNSSYIGGPVMSIANNDLGDKQFWAKWTINTYNVETVAENGIVEGFGLYEYKSTATLKAIANEGYEFVGWNDNELKDERIQLTVTKDTTLVANFKEKEKVQIAGSLEIPTLKTEREATPIDLADLFVTTEGSEISYSATSSAPNVVAATVSEGKLFLTVYEYEGEAEITVTATLPNGEKNSVKATAEVILACNIQVEETITNVSCYGESDGEIALKVTNAAEPYTTLWTGATATTDTIKDVKAGNYEVVITDNENCTFTKTYSVTEPEEMKLSAKIKHPTCDNADGSITITLTGAENASFLWSDESTSQNIANLAKGDYAVVITNTETGCQISDNYTLVEPDAPVVTVSNVVSTACNESNGAVTISVSEEGLLYSWSNNKTTKNLTNVPAGDYTLSVVNPETNCMATLAVTVPSIKLKQPEIALVTVSQQSGKNLVVWLKENTDLIDYYTIYRVDSAKNKYDKVTDVPYSELSVYEDLAANPMERAWKYKMTATDVCGEETAMSDYHSSLHLMKIKSLGVENHLAWDPYEGIDFDSYVILRKTKVKGVVEIDTLATIPSDLTSYTDTLPARGTTSYYVGVKLPEVINPKTQFLKAESGPFVLALSNIAELETVDVPIHTVVKSNVEVYSVGHTIYVKNAESKSISLFDNSGRAVERRKAEMPTEEFTVRLDGVYFVRVDGESFAVIVK